MLLWEVHLTSNEVFKDRLSYASIDLQVRMRSGWGEGRVCLMRQQATVSRLWGLLNLPDVLCHIITVGFQGSQWDSGHSRMYFV